MTALVCAAGVIMASSFVTASPHPLGILRQGSAPRESQKFQSAQQTVSAGNR
jgi:hypothetical protein